MKTFVCKICSYIAFDQAPIDCPVCRAPIENFENNNEAINKPEDPNNLNEIERRHIPVITVSRECGLTSNNRCAAVHVKVGEIEHALESEDHIKFLDFYTNKRHLSRVSLKYKRLHPAVTLYVNVDGVTLSVVGNCVVHGSWMAEVNL